jgi:hypothetical protein
VLWTPQLAVWASMCAAEIVHYRVDCIVKKTWNSLKEQAQLVLHHDKTINQMLAHLEKLEGEQSELDQYQKLSEVVQVWDVHTNNLERACACAVEEAGQLALANQMGMSVLKACFQVGQAELRLAVAQLRECMGVLENSLLVAKHKIRVLKTQVSLFLTLSC